MIRERDRDLARAFDSPRRSQALMQSAVIVSLGLLEPQELARFAPETRDAITVLSKAIQPHRGTQK